jgi:hypothetical protein
VFEFWNYTPYWMYGNVHGRCFDCNDKEFTTGPWIYAKISFNRFATKEDGEIAAGLSPFDMRTLKDIKEGCCPPRLMAHLLETEG